MIEWKDREQQDRYLRECGIESVFPEPLLPHLSLFRFERGELICSQGDTARILYVLVKGKVKIYTASAEGRTLLLAFKTPIEAVGDIEYVRGTDINNTVEAVSPVTMIGIHYRWLQRYGNGYAPLLQFLLDIITRKFTLKSDSLSFNLLYPVEVRLASYLLSVSLDDPDSSYSGAFSTANLKDAANLIGTSYRHVNRVIRRFCSEGLLERRKGFLLVKDRMGLSALAGHNIYE